MQNLEEASSTTRRIGHERESTSSYEIRSIHEMGELKRAQELRVDELSLKKLRESHDTIQKVASQIQELQERVNSMNDSGEFQDIESTFSVKNLTFPVNRQSLRVLDQCWAATFACHLIHGICLKQRETCLAIHVLWSIHHRHIIKEFFTLRIKVPQVQSQCTEVQVDLSREVKNKLGAQHQCRCLHEGRQLWILSYQLKFGRILRPYSKD